MNQASGSGIKTYDDSSVGVSFNYPGNWEISNVKKDFYDKDEKYVFMGDPKERTNYTDEEKKDVCNSLYYVGADVTKVSSSGWSLADEMETLREVKNISIEDGAQVSERNITIDGVTAYELKAVTNDTVSIVITFEKNGSVYEIGYNGKINNWESQYNMIINSFKIK